MLQSLHRPWVQPWRWNAEARRQNESWWFHTDRWCWIAIDKDSAGMIKAEFQNHNMKCACACADKMEMLCIFLPSDGAVFQNMHVEKNRINKGNKCKFTCYKWSVLIETWLVSHDPLPQCGSHVATLTSTGRMENCLRVSTGFKFRSVTKLSDMECSVPRLALLPAGKLCQQHPQLWRSS